MGHKTGAAPCRGCQSQPNSQTLPYLPAHVSLTDSGVAALMLAVIST